MPEETKSETRPIRLLIPRPEGDREIDLRFPSDQEWIKRQNGRRIIQRSLGRGATETEITGAEEADSALLASIAGENHFEPGEATLVLNMLSATAISDVRREGPKFAVRVITYGGTEVTYSVACPNAKQVMDYRRAFSRAIDLPYGQTEFRVNLEAGASLFDTLCDQKATPIIHKTAVIGAVVTELERMMEPSKEGL